MKFLVFFCFFIRVTKDCDFKFSAVSVKITLHLIMINNSNVAIKELNFE